MNSALTLITPTQTPAAVGGMKVVVFPMGNQMFALPVDEGKTLTYPVVQRVINMPPIQLGKTNLQLMHWDMQDVILLNLDRFLTGSETRLPFLMMIETPQSEYYGIPVTDPPSLQELPAASIRSLPPSYAAHRPAQLAQFVSVLPQADQPQVIFLLDLSRVVACLNQS